MPTFPSRPYPSRSSTGPGNTLGERYRHHLRTRPFLLFGFPFMLTMLAGSFFLTPATAVRYERYDRKTHMLDTQTALGLRGGDPGMAGFVQDGMGSGKGKVLRQGTTGKKEGVRPDGVVGGGMGQTEDAVAEEVAVLEGRRKRTGAGATGGGLRGVRAASGRGETRGDIREEYWRLAGMADDYEIKRVKRLPGEPDGTFD